MSSLKDFKTELMGNFPPKHGEFSHYYKYNDDNEDCCHQLVKVEGSDSWFTCRFSCSEPHPQDFVTVHGKIVELGTTINNK
jgi:hypothetical protein